MDHLFADNINILKSSNWKVETTWQLTKLGGIEFETTEIKSRPAVVTAGLDPENLLRIPLPRTRPIIDP